MDAQHGISDAARPALPPKARTARYRLGMRQRSDRLFKAAGRRLPQVILAFGGAASCGGAWMVHLQIEREAQAQFRLQALDYQASISSRLGTYEGILFGIAALYQQVGGEVTREKFQSYAESLDLPTRFPALMSLNYAEYFDARGGSGAAPGEPAEERMIVTRTYPPDSPGLGFNIFGGIQRIVGGPSPVGLPPLRSDMYRPNEPLSLGLPIAIGRPDPGLGIRLGVFTGAGSHARLIGSSGIVFHVDQFFKEALPPALTDRIAYRVSTVGRVDGSSYKQPLPLFSSSPAGRSDAGDMLTTVFSVPFGGARLRVEMREDKADLIGPHDRALPVAVLAGGLLFFLMAATLARRNLERNRELTLAVAVQTANLHREIDRARQLERELAGAIEEERRRIGCELHDDLGQRLTGMSLSFKALSETLQSVSGELSAQAEALERTTSEALSSVRGLAHGLMPVPTGGPGLRLALEELATRVSSMHRLRCVFDFDDPVDINNDTVATNLYRIAQEAVNNAIRHARATRITIRLDEEDGKLTLIVRDDGNGFPREHRLDARPAQLAGAGLRIMAYRASLINCSLSIESSLREGTTIRVQQC